MEALQRLHNRGSISTGYEIDNSIKLEDDNDEFLTRTNASGTNRKTWTVSVWFKQTELASTRNSYTEIWDGGVFGEGTRMGMDNTDRFWIDIGGGTGNTGTNYRNFSTLKLRDTSAWYHLVVALDTTQSTAANRLKVWLNGTEITAWDQQQIPAQNYQCAVEAGVTMTWGAYNATYHGFCGYLAECNYVDGVTATQNDFGEYDEDTGIWKPKEYEGSYGTNGCYLDFEISSDLGANAKGNDVNFSLNNITSANQATDTPTNNFCTLDPNYQALNTISNYHTVSNGATFVTGNQSSTVWTAAAGNIPLFKGKWYWEIKKNGARADTNVLVGVGGIDEHQYNWRALTTITDGAKLMFSYNGTIYGGGSGGFSFDDGDIVSIALDQDNGGFYLRKNGGTWTNSGDPSSGASLTGAQTTPWGTSIVAFNVANNVGGLALNFGGFDGFTVSSGNSDANGYGNFEYAPPSGYYALCTKNLEEFG